MMATDWTTRWKQKHGEFAVPCIVSGRWLQFSQRGSRRMGEGEVLTIDVMTEGSNDKPRKLCDLMITREDLLGVLALIEKPCR